MGELQRNKRPVADISFKSRSRQDSSVNGMRIGSLVLAEIETDAFVSRTLVEPHLSFAILLSGSGTVTENAKTTCWTASRQVYSVSYSRPMLTDFEGFSGVFIRPSFEVLAHLIDDHHQGPGRLSQRLIDACATTYSDQCRGISYFDHLQALLSIVQNSDGDEAFLSRIGIEDVFYRLIAEMVRSHNGCPFDEQKPAPLSRSAKAAELVCEYIVHNLGKPLTISRMEELTGLSGRCLNYAFRSRFDCSPLEWQRNFLLDEARRRLTSPGTVPSVKGVAYELGFASAFSFSSHYKKRFGERPSETMSSAPLRRR